MFALVLLWEGHPAFGGGRLFVGIGAAPLFTPRAVGFFHHRRTGTRFFFQLGQPFVTSPGLRILGGLITRPRSARIQFLLKKFHSKVLKEQIRAARFMSTGIGFSLPDGSGSTLSQLTQKY
jgi:hypothetical protein